MKTYLYKIFAALLCLIASSCDRSGIFEEFDHDIPWGFCVVAVEDEINTKPISGAIVEIYQTAADRDAGINPYLSKTTDTNGEALFTLAEFDKRNQGAEHLKGNYYLRVSKGSIITTATTRYLLMNSGITYQWVQVVE